MATISRRALLADVSALSVFLAGCPAPATDHPDPSNEPTVPEPGGPETTPASAGTEAAVEATEQSTTVASDTGGS